MVLHAYLQMRNAATYGYCLKNVFSEANEGKANTPAPALSDSMLSKVVLDIVICFDNLFLWNAGNGANKSLLHGLSDLHFGVRLMLLTELDDKKDLAVET